MNHSDFGLLGAYPLIASDFESNVHLLNLEVLS